MNVLIVAMDFKPNTGGISEYTHNIARQLKLMGDEVTVFSMTHPQARDFDSTCIYNVVRGDSKLFDYNKEAGIRRTIRMYRIIRSIATDRETDIIICNALTSQPHICWLISRTLGVPFCLFTYGFRIIQRYPLRKNPLKMMLNLFRRFKRWLPLMGADLLFACSNYTKELVAGFGVADCRITVLNPGFDIASLNENESDDNITEKCFPKGISATDKVLLTIGRLIERKGVDKVIEALGIVKKRIPDFLYIIAGEGPYEEELRQLAIKLDLSDRIFFSGYVSEECKHLYYQAADIFIMPSREMRNGHVEGFGIVFLEAGAYSVPVIGGRSGGIPDAIEDGVSGLLVEPFDVEEISSAIIRLFEDEDYSREVGSRGRKRVESKFNWHVLVNEARNRLLSAVERNMSSRQSP